MLYTIMPLDVVFHGQENFQPAFTEIPWKNATLVVEPVTQSSVRVIRLVSTDPMDYLDPAIQPGSIIEYKAESQAAKS